MWLFLRLPTRNIRHSFPSLCEITASWLNMSVSARFFGWDILINMQPMRNASTMEPSKDWNKNKMIPSGHFSVM
ncbi:hypothetical protein NQD34_006175 [Periophthalmus magnuspinnatus]|nr:hypothetical protein NQD34_006175 [Periophthalmus magnuspinnatus]